MQTDSFYSSFISVVSDYIPFLNRLIRIDSNFVITIKYFQKQSCSIKVDLKFHQKIYILSHQKYNLQLFTKSSIFISLLPALLAFNFESSITFTNEI
jgi:hypothetical protein